MKKLIIIYCLIILATSVNAKIILFRGKAKYDKNTETMVKAYDDNEIIKVKSEKHHFIVTLPYSDKWYIEIENENYILYTDNGDILVYLKLLKKSNPEDNDFINELEKDLLKKKSRLVDTIIIEYKNEQVLLTLVDMDHGKKEITYYSAKSYKEDIYLLSISFVLKDPDVGYEEKELLDFLAKGFNVNYKR